MTGTSPELSVVIPTWNGRALLETCLESLACQNFQDFETLVVDDGSTDDTLEFLAAQFPEVLVVTLEKNRGFAVAVNRGIDEARGAWIFLLNNDVTLADDCLVRLMAEARNGTHAMLAPLVLWTEDPRLVYSAGDRIGVSGRPASIGFKTARETLDGAEKPFGVSGGYGLFRRDVIDTVGPLDPAFVAYFEDSDLCFRARWAGYTTALVPEAVAWHIGGASIQNRLWWRTRQCYRNHALLVIKNFSLPLLLRNAGAIARERHHQLGRLFRAARNEFGAVRAMGMTAGAWADLIQHIPASLAARRRIMRTRALSDADMQALLDRGEKNG